MNGWQNKVTSGVNEYVATMKADCEKLGIRGEVSVSLFSGNGMFGEALNITPLRLKVSPDKFEPLTEHMITPYGNTPLYDAAGNTVNDLLKETGIDEKNVSLVVLTDGEENSSKSFTAGTIKEKFKWLQDTKNWLIIYLGANQDAWAEGGKMGTNSFTTSGYSMNNINVAVHNASRSTMRYAAAGSVAAAAFTAQELAENKGDK
jgi:hypothetical protein